MTVNPTNYDLSDSVAATEGVVLYSGFPDYNAFANSKISKSKMNLLKSALHTYNYSLHI